ncbi:MAG TPA: hypothetical protein VLA34_11725, partial [Candidatus Krumholzibacterium sp.]|nr:hypothetical protein [Candidatus Krumholzibacterium sp.]
MSAFFSGVAIKVFTAVCMVLMLGVGRVARTVVSTVSSPLMTVSASLQGAADEDTASSAAAADSTAVSEKDTTKTSTRRTGRVKYRDRKDIEKSVKISISDKGVRIGSEDGEDVYLQLDTENISKSVEDALSDLDDVDIDLSGLFGAGGLDGDNREFRTVYNNQVVRFGEDITIDRFELVRGDVVSIFGDVEVEGKVTGDVVSILGDVILGPTAIVNGEVVSVLGSVSEDDDARVRGQTVVVGSSPTLIGMPFHTDFGGGIFRMIGKIITFVVGALLLMLILYFLPDRMQKSCTFVSGSFFKALGVGVLVLVFGSIVVGIVAAILSITIIGIPVAILLGLSYGALILMGYFVSAVALGKFLSAKFNLESSS